VASAVMPYSQSFKEMGSSESPFVMLFIMIYGVFVCLTIYFIIRHAHSNGTKLFLNIIFVMFFVQSFMTHIESLFINGPFYTLTKLDVFLVMLSGLFPLIAVTPLLIKFFQIKDRLLIKNKINVKILFVKLCIIGILYLCSYILFGFIVTWLFEKFQTHYGESIANTPNAYLYAFIQILRGILYGVFIIPLKNIIKAKREFILSVCMVYLCTSVQLIIPNEFIPNHLRVAYFIEMTGAMLLFGILVGNIIWWDKKQKTSA
jgi:hypothetical protein